MFIFDVSLLWQLYDLWSRFEPNLVGGTKLTLKCIFYKFGSDISTKEVSQKNQKVFRTKTCFFDVPFLWQLYGYHIWNRIKLNLVRMCKTSSDT